MLKQNKANLKDFVQDLIACLLELEKNLELKEAEFLDLIEILANARKEMYTSTGKNNIE